MEPANSTDRHPVEELAEEFVAQLRAGQSPSIEEFAHAHPQHASTIRAVFPSLVLVERVSASDGTTTQAARVPQSSVPLTTEVPRSLADFEIVRLIGRGGMGAVYEAIQVSLRRTVALKVMHPQASASEQSRARFRCEAESAASLHHTNIVPVYGSGEDHGLLYYAMQLIEGPTLAQVIEALQARKGPATTESTTVSATILSSLPTVPRDYQRQICRLIAQVASALDYAHQSGVLHRDIKPGNLLLDHTGTIWVADFGLAHRSDLDSQTQSGEVLGTLRYMAPEQLTGHADSRSDIYSLGLTLFELLTLRPAIAAPKRRLLHSPPLTHLEFTPTEQKLLPRDLQTIVLQATAAEPERRYQQARDLQDDLQRLLDDRPILARRASPLEVALRWGRRNPAIAGLTTTLFAALLLIVTLLGIWNRQQRATLAELRIAHQATATSLQERTVALQQAESASRRAARNLTLALEAFNTITDNIAARGRSLELQDLEQAELDSLGFTDAVLSQADVDLLNSLQLFFERFAAENATDLRLEAAIARRRVGEIEHRIGKYEQAARSLSTALAEFEAIRSLPDMDHNRHRLLREEFKVRDELIRLAVRRDQFTKAQGDMERLREVLRDFPEFAASAHGRYALASSLTSLGSGGSRLALERNLNDRRRRPSISFDRPPAFGPLASNPINTRRERDLAYNAEAIQLLEGLTAEDPGVTQYQLDLARCYRDRMRLSRMLGKQPDFDSSLAKATAILRALLDETPASALLKYELASLYAGSLTSSAGDGHRLEEALKLIQEVLGQYPLVPEYQTLHASLLVRAAWKTPTTSESPLERQLERAEGGIAKLQQAIAIQQGLVERFPDIPLYAINLLLTKVQLVEFHVQFRRPERAKQALADAIALAEKLLAVNASRQPVVRVILDRLRERQAAFESRSESAS